MFTQNKINLQENKFYESNSFIYCKNNDNNNNKNIKFNKMKKKTKKTMFTQNKTTLFQENKFY